MRIALAFAVFLALNVALQYKLYSEEFIVKRVSNEAHLYSRDVSDTFAKAKHLATLLSAMLERADWESRSVEELQQILQTRASILSNVRLFLLIDKDGVQRAISLKEQGTAINVSDRAYFKKLKSGELDTWYGKYTGRNTSTSAYSYARTIYKDGKFNGVLLIVFDIAKLIESCSTLSSSGDKMLLVKKSSGQVISGCGLDFKTLISVDTYINSIIPKLDLSYRMVDTVGTSVRIVKPVKSNSDLVVVAEADLSSTYRTVYTHLIAELLIFMIALAILRFKI
jgi:hypothetical protein